MRRLRRQQKAEVLILYGADRKDLWERAAGVTCGRTAQLCRWLRASVASTRVPMSRSRISESLATRIGLCVVRTRAKSHAIRRPCPGGGPLRSRAVRDCVVILILHGVVLVF